MGQVNCCTTGAEENCDAERPERRERKQKSPKGKRKQKKLGAASPSSSDGLSNGSDQNEQNHTDATSEGTSTVATLSTYTSSQSKPPAAVFPLHLRTNLPVKVSSKTMGVTLRVSYCGECFVASVLPNSAAAEAGLKPGSLIVAIEGVMLSSPADVKAGIEHLLRAGKGVVSVVPSFSTRHIKRHDKKDDCWVTIGGKTYDMTAFLKAHPGGSDAIMEFAGTDATIEFFSVHSEERYLKALDKYCIGASAWLRNNSDSAELIL